MRMYHLRIANLIFSTSTHLSPFSLSVSMLQIIGWSSWLDDDTDDHQRQSNIHLNFVIYIGELNGHGIIKKKWSLDNLHNLHHLCMSYEVHPQSSVGNRKNVGMSSSSLSSQRQSSHRCYFLHGINHKQQLLLHFKVD